MAISKNTSSKYKKGNKDYKNSSAVDKKQKAVISVSQSAPKYVNSYADSLKDLYSRIKNGKEFSYSPENDSAFRRFADEYNLLSSLAVAENQAQANGLTGGYASGYSADASAQGLQRMKEGAESAQPDFYKQAQEVYLSDNNALYDAYNALSDARNDEMSEYQKKADAFNERQKTANNLYSDNRDFDYEKFKDNRDYWAEQLWFEQNSDNQKKELKQKNTEENRAYKLKENENKRNYKLESYETYNKIASENCARFKAKEDNKGMRKYLDNMVKKGFITSFMANNLYNKYKFDKK